MFPQITPNLILLPAVPSSPSTSASSTHTWHSPLKSALSALSTSSHQSLDLGILIANTTTTPRCTHFNALQHIIASAYRLGAHIQAELGLDPVAPTYVNVRVYLITDNGAAETVEPASSITGPVFTLRQLAECARRYQNVWMPKGSDVGKRFVAMRKASKGSDLAKFTIHDFDISAGSALDAESTADTTTSSGTASDHHVVAVGGTFDNLHEGHKLLLSAFALVPEPSSSNTSTAQTQERRLVVGITGDQLLVNKKYAAMLEDWEARAVGTFRFLASVLTLSREEEYSDSNGSTSMVTVTRRHDPGPNGKVIEYRLPGGLMIQCVEIQDPFGPTITDEHISALVVSAETRSGGKAVNERRTEKGWKPLEVFEVDVLAPEQGDGQSVRDEAEEIRVKISSTEMRKRRFEAMQGPKM